jgi:hypothetical protein
MASGSTAMLRRAAQDCLCQASAEHFQQCAEFLPLRNRGLGPLAVPVLPIPFARRATGTACAAVQSTAPLFRCWRPAGPSTPGPRSGIRNPARSTPAWRRDLAEAGPLREHAPNHRSPITSGPAGWRCRTQSEAPWDPVQVHFFEQRSVT